MEPKSVDFSVIKQKIIKTDEVLQMYLETEKKLKKAQLVNKNMKVQATTSLNRLRLENERYTFTIESTKTKCNDLQSENQQLMEQKSSLEKKYSSLLVDSQSTILELQNELKMIKDLNASADKLSVSPKRKTVHESNSSKKYKELEVRLKNVQENEQKLKEQNERLLLDQKQITDEITQTKSNHSRVIASLNFEKSKLEREFKQLCSQIDSEKHQQNVMRDKDYEISKLKAEVLALRELKEQIKHLQEQNKKLNSDLSYKDGALYKAKEKLQAIQNVHTLHAETQTAPEPEVEPSKCSCVNKEPLCKKKIMVCSITQTEPIAEDSDSNLHKVKENKFAIQNVHTVHAETQTGPEPEGRPSKCSCNKNEPLCTNKIMVCSITQTDPLTGYSDSNLHKAKEKIYAKARTLHAETQTSSDLQMEPPNCSCFHKEPSGANKLTACSFTQTESLTAYPISKFDDLSKDHVVDDILKEMIFFPQMLSPIRNLMQDEIILDKLPKFAPRIPDIMITPSTPLEKKMPLFADIPAKMERFGIIPKLETANQKIVNVRPAEKKLASGIFAYDIPESDRKVMQYKDDNIEVLDLRKCAENLVPTENNIADPAEPKGDNGLIKTKDDGIAISDLNTSRKDVVTEEAVTEQKKFEHGRYNSSIQNGDEENLVPEEVETELQTSRHGFDNELIQNSDGRIDALDLNTDENILVPQKVPSDLKKFECEKYNSSIQNGDEKHLVTEDVAIELKTSKHECDNVLIQNRDGRIDALDLNTNENILVPQNGDEKNLVFDEVAAELKTSEHECDNESMHNRDQEIDTPDQNTSGNNSVPEEVLAELKKHEYNNILSIEQTKDSERAKSIIEKPLRKRRFRTSTVNSNFIKKQVAMKHANKKCLSKKRFMSRKLKTQDSVLRALQVLKQSKINFTISNESTLPLLLHEHDWLNKHCHTSTNYVPPPVQKVPNTKADKRLVEKLRCSSSCCNKMFMLLSGKPRNPNLHGFFKVKKEQESPLYSRMDRTTEDQPDNPLKWLNESLRKEITPENLLDTLAELVSQKLRENKISKRKRSSPSENSEFFSETETEIERLFPDPKNTLERNKMLLKKAKYDMEMESTSVTSLEEHDMKNVSSQSEEKFDECSSLSKQISQEHQVNVTLMPLVNSPVRDLQIILRTPEKKSRDIEDVESCDSFRYTIHPDILSPLSTSTATESPKPKIIEATEFPSSIKNTPDQRDISRKIEFKSPSCSQKTEFSSLFSSIKIESTLREEICSTGYTNSFSVVRSPQSQTITKNSIHHHTSAEKNATHQNQSRNFVDGICKLENTNICLVETKTNMSEDKLNYEVVDCKKYILDQSSSFQSSFDMMETKTKQQIKPSSVVNNVNVTPNSDTCIKESEKTISDNELNNEVIDREKNILDKSSSCKSSFEVDDIENEQQTKQCSVTDLEVTPNSDTCISKFLTNESEMSEEVGNFINNFDLNGSFRDNSTPLKRPKLPNIGRELFSTQAVSPIEEKLTKITTDIIDLLASPSISEKLPDCIKLPENRSPNIRSYKQDTYMSLGMEFSDEDDGYKDNELSNVRYSPEHHRDTEFARKIKCDGPRLGELSCPKSPQPRDVELFDNKDIKIISFESTTEIQENTEQDNLANTISSGGYQNNRNWDELSGPCSPHSTDVTLKICRLDVSMKKNHEQPSPQTSIENATELRPLEKLVGLGVDLRADISKSDNQLDFPQSPEHSDAQLLMNEDIKIIPLERTTDVEKDVEKDIEKDITRSLLQRSKTVKSDHLLNLTSQIEICPSHSTVDAIKGEEDWRKLHPKTSIVGLGVDLRADISKSENQLDFPQSPEHSDAQLLMNEDIKIIPLERTTDVEKDIEEDNTSSLLQRSKTVKSDQLLNITSQIETRPSHSTVDVIKGEEYWRKPHPKTSIVGRDEDLRDDISESDNKLECPQSPEHSDAQLFVNKDLKIIPLERTTDVEKDIEEDNTSFLLQRSKTVKSDQLLNITSQIETRPSHSTVDAIKREEDWKAPHPKTSIVGRDEDLRDDISESDNQLDFPLSQLFVNEDLKIIPLERTTDVGKDIEDNSPYILQHSKTVKSDQLPNLSSQIEIRPPLSTVNAVNRKEDWKEPHPKTSIIGQDLDLRGDISESDKQLDYPQSPELSDAQFYLNEYIKIIPIERSTDLEKDIEEDKSPSLSLPNLTSQIEIRPSLSTVNALKRKEDWKEPHPKTSIIGQDVDLRDDIPESDKQLDFPQSPKFSDAQFYLNEYIKIIPIEISTDLEKDIEEDKSPSLSQRSKTLKSDKLPTLTSQIEIRPSLSTVNAVNRKEDWKEPHPKTAIIGQDVDLRNDISESDDQLECPQSPEVLNDQFFINEDIKLIPLERGTYLTKRNEDSPPPLCQNSKKGHKEIHGPLPNDKAMKTFHLEGDCERVDSLKFPQASDIIVVERGTPLEVVNSVGEEKKAEISEPVKRKRGRPRKQKIETEPSAEFDAEHSNSNLKTLIQGKRELRSQAPKTLGSSKKIEAMKRRRKSTRLTGTLANSNEQQSTENDNISTMISRVEETLKPPPKRYRENKQPLSKEFVDSDGSDSESDAQNRTKKICTETKISNDSVPTGNSVDNTVISCKDGSGIARRLPSKSQKKSTPSKRPKNKPMTKMKSNVLRQMNLKRKMFQSEAPSSTVRSIESNCDVKISATDRLNVEIKDNVNKIRSNIDVTKELPPTKNKITVVQNFLIPPGDSNPVDLLKFNPPTNLISEPSSSQNSLGPTETEIIPTKRKTKRKDPSLHNSCDILSQIIGQMDKNRPEITVKPKLVNKDVPAGTEEKQWRTRLLDIAEIVHNKDAQTQDLYGRQGSLMKAIGVLKKGSQLTGKMKVMVGKLVNIPDEDDIPRAIILEFKMFKLDDTIDAIIHEVAKDFLDNPIDKYYPAPLMTKTQRLYLNLLVSLENEVTDNVLDMFLSRTEQYILRIGCGLNAAVPLTRLYLAICRLKADINRMRTFCCDAFFYVGNLAVPILFTVLTSWIEVIPMAADVDNYPIANVLVQLVHLKNFYQFGYNLIALRCLLHQYHGYPKERRNCDELFEEIFHQYLRNPTPTSNFAIRLFCRHKENKWVYKKINEFFKPLIYKIPMENVNFKATIIMLLGKICKQFKPKEEHDAACLVELNRFFLDLIEDDMPDLVRKSVSWSIDGLPKKRTENPAQKPEGDSASHSENPS